MARANDSVPAARALSEPLRRIVVRLAEVVCPPELRTDDLADDLVAEFESLLGVLPGMIRRPVLVGLVAFDRGARLYPRARGRRFVSLPGVTAEAYFRAVLARRSSGLGTALARLKALVVMCYYELPAVKDGIGYRPDPYIAVASKRRLVSYAAEIAAGEAAVLAPDPAGSDIPGPPVPRPGDS